MLIKKKKRGKTGPAGHQPGILMSHKLHPAAHLKI